MFYFRIFANVFLILVYFRKNIFAKIENKFLRKKKFFEKNENKFSRKKKINFRENVQTKIFVSTQVAISKSWLAI
jgi:hypothetical protein